MLFYAAGVAGKNVTSGAAVVIDASGQLGVVSSSRRYNQDFEPLGDMSDRLLALRPVSFRYKKANRDGTRSVQYGLVAEEVVKVLPELVVYGGDGRPESVAYHVLPTLPLNGCSGSTEICRRLARCLTARDSSWRS